MEPILRAIDLVYYYQHGETPPVRALNGINLQVREGEYVAIVGPNGSGKSTLLKHFNALLLPSAGEVIVNGLSTRDIKNRWKIRQTCGMVFQNPDNQIVATTVEEDVAFGLENLAVPPSEIRERIEESLALVGMSPFKNHAPHLLSGGQKQRVAIAGVIAMRPRCLLLDEPTAMLDPQGKREVIRTIKRLNRQEGITVVQVTHFMDEALEADRVVVINEGEIYLDDTPEEVFTNNAAEIREIGLEVPPVIDLVQQLRFAGMDIPRGTLHVDELVKYLCS